MQLPPSCSTSDNRFAATRWSLVAAATTADAPSARQALIELCLRYWYPVYAFIRGSGHDVGMAQDISRAFFENLMQQRLTSEALHAGGRFRDVLLQSLRRYLEGDWKQAQEPPQVAEFELRGAWEGLEARYRAESESALDAEQRFQRGYAIEILSSALARLRAEAVRAGREAMFTAMQPYLSAEPGPGEYAALARTLDLRPLAVVVALKRLRQRYRELAEAELGETVSSPADLAEEREALARALAIR